MKINYLEINYKTMFLVVEDNKILAKNILKVLQSNDFKAEIAESAEIAEQKLKEKRYDLIILDINLPWKNGLDFLKQIREKQNNIPVLIVTSKTTTDDIIQWLENGADDYIWKPFNILEFIARIKAILRRHKWVKTKKLQIKEFEIYPDEEKVLKNGAQIQLSSLEFKLLMYFIKNKWKVLNRQEIYEQVWWDFDNHMFSRTVDVHVWYLRKKLDKELIKTRKWSGYYFNDELLKNETSKI